MNTGGDLYVRGLTDCILEGAQFQSHGFFKTGRDASELMSNSPDAVYPYNLTEESMVLLRASMCSAVCIPGWESARHHECFVSGRPPQSIDAPTFV